MPRRSVHILASLLTVLTLFAPPALAVEVANYLPLAVGNKWVLRNPHQKKPVVFEVVGQDGDGYVLQSATPWSSSRWTLTYDNGRYRMNAYGNGTSGPMMRMAEGPVYLDFTQANGEQWSNVLGTLTIVSRSVTVRSQSQTYAGCVQLVHQAKRTKLWSTFARGVGYVQFGEGKSAFVLDEAASTLPPPGEGSTEPPVPEPRHPEQPVTETRSSESSRSRRGLHFGITPNQFAHEPLTEAVMMQRLQQTVDAGVTYISGTAKWAELEPAPGRYSLGSVSTFLSAARSMGLPVSYTLRIIDTVACDVPPDLRNTDWADRRMRDRATALIETIAPLLKDQVRWLSVGYEIDGYLAKHPREAESFQALYAAIKARLAALLPGVPVSSTVTFAGIGALNGPLRGLDSQLDFLSVTYAPLQPDFTVMEPAVVRTDFARMKQAAGRRKIVLQEIGYPTAPETGSSASQQAEFYRLALAEINRDPNAFAAVNFMTLADLSRERTRHLASFYGLHTPGFEGTLRSMGLFDEHGNPKEAWGVLQSALQGGKLLPGDRK